MSFLYRMFYNCKNLKKFEGYEFRRCEYMTSMFEKCKSLSSCVMSMSSYYESNPKEPLYMDSMFAECENLEVVTFEELIWPKTIHNMFYNCKKLTSIGDQMDLEYCESMSHAFSNCESLVVVILQKVKYGINYDDIFYNCHNLSFVYFPTEYLNIINIGKMFEYCSKLEYIFTSEKVNKDNIIKRICKIKYFSYCYNKKCE